MSPSKKEQWSSPGADLSGVNYTGQVPTMDYEVELEAQRVDGSDFFWLTFRGRKTMPP
ncbi:MAG: hypothetical protein R3C11_28265 [Planctomycetaceae bacterium]